MRLIRDLGLPTLLNTAAGDAPTGAGASPPPAAAPPAAAPSAPVAPPPAALSATAQAPAATPPAPDREPNWLNDRIAKAKKSAEASLLKELGVESLDDAKKAIEALRAQEEAKKSVEQKAAEYENALKAERERIAKLTDALKAHASAQLASLTEEQRAAVAAIAGDDPAQQLKTIEALRPTWKSGAAPATAPATAPVAAPPAAPSAPADDPIAIRARPGLFLAAPATPAPPPADTAPAPNAPKDAQSVSPADPKAVYLELKKTNPVIAARYALQHGIHDSK